MITAVHVTNLMILAFVFAANLAYYATVRHDRYRNLKLWYAINSLLAMATYAYWWRYDNIAVMSITFVLAATMAGGTMGACARAVDIYRVDPLKYLLHLPIEALRMLL